MYMYVYVYTYRYVVKRKLSEDDYTTQQAATNNTPPPPAKRHKKERGQNKRRPRAAKVNHSEQLCPSLYEGSKAISSNSCRFGENCRYSHNCTEFLASKPPDIRDTCFLFTTLGRCPYGLACRYGNSHMTPDKQNMIDDSVYDPNRIDTTRNIVSKSLQQRLRKKNVDLPKSEHFLQEFNKVKDEGRKESGCGLDRPSVKEEVDDKGDKLKDNERVTSEECPTVVNSKVEPSQEHKETVENCSNVALESAPSAGSVTDEDLIRLRPSEMKQVLLCTQL